MGLLDKLWDDTLAGPRPETGLGKLRKYDSIPATHSPATIGNVPPISRSITILKPKSNGPDFSSDSSDLPSSPSTPSTPTQATPREGFKRLMRGKSMPSEAFQRAEPRSPTVYDWVVISALDR